MTAAMKDARRRAVDAAVSVAEDIAAGKLSPDALQAAAVAELHALFTTVVGPDDPAWPDQVAVARGVLALDGIPVDELAEWLAVTRTAQGIEAEPAEPSWIEQALAQMADEPEDHPPRDIDVRMLGRCRCGEPHCGGEHDLPTSDDLSQN